MLSHLLGSVTDTASYATAANFLTSLQVHVKCLFNRNDHHDAGSASKGGSGRDAVSTRRLCHWKGFAEGLFSLQVIIDISTGFAGGSIYVCYWPFRVSVSVTTNGKSSKGDLTEKRMFLCLQRVGDGRMTCFHWVQIRELEKDEMCLAYIGKITTAW